MQSRRIRGKAGEPLPVVFPSLEQMGTQFVTGNLSLIAAGPGTGKSALALTIALKTAVPCLYFSADSDAFTQLRRSMSILTGCSQEAAGVAIRSGEFERFDSELRAHPIRFEFDASPSIESIELSLAAYEEVFGEFPELIEIDNVTNVRSGGNDEDPFSGLEGLMDYLHSMARETGAHVMGLHHVTGGYVNGDKPIPLDGVKGQITRVPELVITAHRRRSFTGAPDTLCLSTVKNRNGREDSSGYTYVELDFDGSMMQITDPLTKEVAGERDTWQIQNRGS